MKVWQRKGKSYLIRLQCLVENPINKAEIYKHGTIFSIESEISAFSTKSPISMTKTHN